MTNSAAISPTSSATVGGLPACGASAIDCALANLDAWLDSMRSELGYGGPVSHWWQQCFLYTGPGLDWRYEGIIAGYLSLWQHTSDATWLSKAKRAGDDLMRGQLDHGHFRCSAFEINPAMGGTPHEAACDVGLLMLAQELRRHGDENWLRYAGCAERNVRGFLIGQLWDEETHSFADGPGQPSFVPNKAATASEALFLLAELREDDELAARYAVPSLGRILDHQCCDGSRLDGAIAQNSLGSRRVEKYFPLYVARCVSALLEGWRWTQDERFAESALRAMRFVARWMDVDGILPVVVYSDRRAIVYPHWIAPLGDILRMADALRPLGFTEDMTAAEQRLLAGQDESGGIDTAFGFAAQSGGQILAAPDVRDVLHVAGWCDKAFRHLAAHAGRVLPEPTGGEVERHCTFRGRRLRMHETRDRLEFFEGEVLRYLWMKGQDWPVIAMPEFWLR